jgi:hypothetical protein
MSPIADVVRSPSPWGCAPVGTPAWVGDRDSAWLGDFLNRLTGQGGKRALAVRFVCVLLLAAFVVSIVVSLMRAG